MLPSQAKEDSQTQQASEGQCLFLWPPEEEGGWSADAARGTERRERGLRSPGPEPSCLPAASMAPQRKSDFSQVVLRALCTGACVSLVNACVAGECRPRGLRTQSRARRGAPASLAVLGWRCGGQKGAGPCPLAAFSAQGSSTCPGALRWTVCPS